MPPTLHRLTTEYIDQEDRIRLSGATLANGERDEVRVLWLTQRLLYRVLPVLLDWLEQGARRHPYGELWSTMAQQAAQAALQGSAPVRAPVTSNAALVTSIDIAHNDEALRLTFRAGQEELAELPLEAHALRQWLGILQQQMRKAEWPDTLWPEWMQEAAAPPAAQAAMLH